MTESIAAIDAAQVAIDRVALASTEPGATDSFLPATLDSLVCSDWEPLPEPGRRVSRLLIRGLIIALGGALAIVLVAAAVRVLLTTQLRKQPGTLVGVESGDLELLSFSGWRLGEAGDSVTEGTALRSRSGVVATVEFADQSLMRVESDGEWLILSQRSMLGGRKSRVTVRQLEGTTTFASAPLRNLTDNTFRVQVPWATFELIGVASVTTPPDDRTEVTVLQGTLRLHTVGEPIVIRAGQRLCLAPGIPPRLAKSDALACE